MSEAKSAIARALMGEDTRPRGAIPEEDWYQMQFAPIKVRKGEWDWGVPGMIQEPYDAWKREWDSARGIGEGVTQDQVLEDALSVAGVMAPAGLGRAGGITRGGVARPAGMAVGDVETLARDAAFDREMQVIAERAAKRDARNSEYLQRMRAHRDYVRPGAAQERAVQAANEWKMQLWAEYQKRQSGAARPDKIPANDNRFKVIDGNKIKENSSSIAAIVAALQGEDRR